MASPSEPWKDAEDEDDMMVPVRVANAVYDLARVRVAQERCYTATERVLRESAEASAERAHAAALGTFMPMGLLWLAFGMVVARLLLVVMGVAPSVDSATEFVVSWVQMAFTLVGFALSMYRLRQRKRRAQAEYAKYERLLKRQIHHMDRLARVHARWMARIPRSED